MTSEQRMKRIGELLSKGVSLMLAQARKAPKHQPISKKTLNPDEHDDISKIILLFIQKVGSASPRELESRLNLGRRTVLRHLKKLHKAEFLIKKGNTTATTYELCKDIGLQDVTSGTSCAGSIIPKKAAI